MSLSVLKILSGSQDVKAETLTLTVEYINGLAEAGDFIFLKEHFFSVSVYPIKKSSKKSWEQYKMVIKFPEQDWMWKDRIQKHILKEDHTAVCGITVADPFKQ